MKLHSLKIKERLDRPSTALFASEVWDLSFEAGLATLVHRETKEEFLIPASNILWMKRASPDAKPAR